MTRVPALPLLSLFCLLSLGGCSSIAKGVTEAVMDRQNEAQEDTRQCEIEGPAFDGISQSLDSQTAARKHVTKILMVHGINRHEPGYSSRFQKKLYDELGLDIADVQVKTIALDDKDIAWAKGEKHEMGSLRITRHTDRERKREVIFYELTWSPITDGQKQTLAADSDNNEGLTRANLNNSLKSFMNATVPDLLIYNGNGYSKITTAVAQSVCWMFATDWQHLPKDGQHACDTWPQSTFADLAADDHFFITHSLGSRITIDTVQNFANLNDKQAMPMHNVVTRILHDKNFTVFMMANQLPLLQMGRNPPEVAGQNDQYCAPAALKAGKRLLKRMNIVAFSDPNDILSYPVPLDFAAQEIDSRICPSITNISLNVADQKNLFDTVSFANPLTAHSGYMEDDRVISLIARGIGGGADTLAEKRCRWIENRVMNW